MEEFTFDVLNCATKKYFRGIIAVAGAIIWFETSFYDAVCDMWTREEDTKTLLLLLPNHNDRQWSELVHRETHKDTAVISPNHKN